MSAKVLQYVFCFFFITIISSAKAKESAKQVYIFQFKWHQAAFLTNQTCFDSLEYSLTHNIGWLVVGFACISEMHFMLSGIMWRKIQYA